MTKNKKSIHPLNTSEYRLFIQSNTSREAFKWQSPTDAKEDIAPIVYSTDGNLVASSSGGSLDERFSFFVSEGKNRSFLRIFNEASFIPKTELSLNITPEEYRLVQQLGLTQTLDQSLTAKIIGSFGHYRFRVLKDQEQYRMRTHSFHEKEAICQYAFDRLYALQKIERTFGKKWEVLNVAITDYQNELLELIDQRQLEFAKAKGWTHITDEFQKGNLTKEQVLDLLRNATDAEQKFFLRQTLEIFKDIEAVSKLHTEVGKHLWDHQESTPYGVDSTKSCIEKFVRDRANQIIRHAKFENELTTLVDKNSTFRGLLAEHLGTAEITCRDFMFDQRRLITPKSQGDYSQHLKRITLTSSLTIGSEREDMRRFLLCSSYLLNRDPEDKTTDPFQSSDQEFDKKYTRGWSRLLRREGSTRPIFKTYKQLRQLASKASISRYRLFVEDFRELWTLLTHGVAKATRGILSAAGREFYQLYDDFLPKPAEIPKRKSPIVLEENEFRLLIEENWQGRWSEPKKLHYVIDRFVKVLDAKNIPLDPTQKEFIAALRNQASPKKEIAPLAMPPSQLDQTNPDDFLSSIVGGTETFYRFFDKIYEINPCMSFYASVLYIFSGLAAVNPELTQGLLSKINLKALAQPFIAWNTATAQAMTNGQISNFISAGFTAWQELLVISKALGQGSDSPLGEICRYVNYHLLKTIGGVLSAYGLGSFITTHWAGYIPGMGDLGKIIKEDAGNQAYIGEFFAGIKLATLAYEALESTPDTQSALANFCSFLIKCALYPARLLLSVINMGWAIINPDRWNNAAQPWKDLLHDTKSALLRTIDAGLRWLNLVGQAVKRSIKMVVEWAFNTLTIATKWLLAPVFLLPFMKNSSNIFAAGLLRLKTNLIAMGDAMTRVIKNMYRESRNIIARALRPELTVAAPAAQSTVRFSTAHMLQKTSFRARSAAGESTTDHEVSSSQSSAAGSLSGSPRLVSVSDTKPDISSSLSLALPGHLQGGRNNNDDENPQPLVSPSVNELRSARWPTGRMGE